MKHSITRKRLLLSLSDTFQYAQPESEISERQNVQPNYIVLLSMLLIIKHDLATYWELFFFLSVNVQQTLFWLCSGSKFKAFLSSVDHLRLSDP